MPNVELSFLALPVTQCKNLVLCCATGDWHLFIHRQRDRSDLRQKVRVSTTALRYRHVVLYDADQIPSWRNRMYFTGDRNTVNSCCTISILKNPQQFAWGWEIRHQTSKNRRILHESCMHMLAGGCTPKWAQFR